jgi:hypothetical protein
LFITIQSYQQPSSSSSWCENFQQNHQHITLSTTITIWSKFIVIPSHRHFIILILLPPPLYETIHHHHHYLSYDVIDIQHFNLHGTCTNLFISTIIMIILWTVFRIKTIFTEW